ncbi:MAG: hypothetical protein JWM23_857 [Microbacteriaceae bacterium]|nr:hypothetical protein [Microbacteriaceae bacterium]
MLHASSVRGAGVSRAGDAISREDVVEGEKLPSQPCLRMEHDDLSIRAVAVRVLAIVVILVAAGRSTELTKSNTERRIWQTVANRCHHARSNRPCWCGCGLPPAARLRVAPRHVAPCALAGRGRWRRARDGAESVLTHRAGIGRACDRRSGHPSFELRATSYSTAFSATTTRMPAITSASAARLASTRVTSASMAASRGCARAAAIASD